MDTDPRNGMNILPESACLQLLSDAEIGRLAVAVDGRPDIFPVNHLVHDGAIYIRTAEGSKLMSVAINEWVAFEVDGFNQDENTAWSVVVHGTAESVDTVEVEDFVAALPLHPWNTAPKNRFIRISPTTISGREFVAEGRTVS